MNRQNKLLIALTIITISFMNICVRPVTIFAWGDNYVDSNTGEKGRPSYTTEEINKGAIGATPESDGENYKDSPNYPGTIVFNSISDSMPMGDGVNGGSEKNFVGARECVLRADKRCEGDVKTNGWYYNELNVEDGKTYIIRMYVHNNNPNGTDAVAENTHVSFSIPSASGKQVQVNGFIDTTDSRAKETGVMSEYWDDIVFKNKDNIPFHLEYVFGSALLENNKVGLGGLTLSDDVVKSKSGGILIGYDALDGRVPGCYEYANYVTIQVKAVFDYDYTVTKKVRLSGGTDRTWKDSIDAKVGDKLEFRIEYKNTSDKQQNNVAVKDILPANLEYISGMTILKNSLHESGLVLDQDYLVENGLLIGSYGPGANAFIYFAAEVVDEDLDQGLNILTNWAQVGVGDVTIQDSVEIRVRNDRKYYMLLTVYGVIIAVCFLIIVLMIWRIIKRNNLKRIRRRR